MSGSNFSFEAPHDGAVTGVDTKHQLLELTPNPITVKTVGSINLKDYAKDIDVAAPQHKYFRAYIKDGNYNVGEIYNLTDKSVGYISHIEKDINPEAIPTEMTDKYHGKLILVTFILSPKIYTPTKSIFKYGEKYTHTQGIYLKQDLVVNVRVGDKVKKGDILIYNAGFFAPKTDPFGPGVDKGVDWKYGVTANVVLIETSSTYEDACAITEDFGKKLKMYPAHIRDVIINKNTIIHQCVSVGDDLYSTDPVCTIEDGDLEILGGVDDPDSVEFLNSLSQQKVKAKYSGKVAEIDILYGCHRDKLHPTIKKLVASIEKRNRDIGVKLGKSNEELQAVNGYVTPGTKYQGTLFTEDTVRLNFTIVQEIGTKEGDKLCIMTSNKTIISEMLDKPPIAENGKVIDVVFSVTSPYKRIVMSPFTNGVGNQILEDAEGIITKLYNS